MRILNDILHEGSQDFDLWDRAIIMAYVGSLSHGTYEAGKIDDKDVMGIIAPPADYVLGLKQFGRRGTKEIKRDPWDVVLYELPKLVSLLLKNNPNVLGLLWLEDSMYLKCTKHGKWLIEYRDSFSSKLAYNSFCGYAYSQLKKMEKNAYLGYMGKVRKELTDKIGYDSKNASHLVRLLKMGIEFLETGQVNVKRKDASMLLEIKRGEWKLDKVKREADELFKALKDVKEKSPLPEKPDYDRVNTMLKQIQYDILRGETIIGYHDVDEFYKE